MDLDTGSSSGSSDRNEEVFENRRGVPTAIQAGARNTATWQTLTERYGRAVQVRPAQAEREGGRVSARMKQRFWMTQEKLAGRALSETVRHEWLLTMVSTSVAGVVSTGDINQNLHIIREMRGASYDWLKPKAKGLPCVRALNEATWSAKLSISEALLSVRALKPRSSECVWTRYLSVAMQRCVMLKEARPMHEILEEVSMIFSFIEGEDKGRTLAYVIVPRKSSKWYIGITKT